jgi:cellulose synthase operon protein YhjQ
MPSENPPDVDSLFSAAGLAAESYLQFNRRRGAVAEAEAVAPPPFPSVEPAPAATQPVEIVPRPIRIAPRRILNRGDRWLGLQAVLEDSTAQVPSPASQPTGNILLFPSAGGVGATTIAATLARVLHGPQTSVGVVDNSSHSLIPMHFGARGTRSGCSSFYFQKTGGASPVHLITPKSTPTLLERNSDPESEAWVKEGFDQIQGSCDYLLVDIWGGISLDLLTRLSRNSVCLVPLVPDVSSTIRLRPILDTFEQISAQCNRRVEPYFLLTKFDESISLHADLRRWLGEQLKGRLLPFVIRRSDDAAAALAEGETVVDYAPASGMAADFQHLGEWVKTRFHAAESIRFRNVAGR